MTPVDFARLKDYDSIIDVRSPAEFADDHLPDAINCPVLDDAERVRVGTLYKQVSPFDARKLGAALVSRNLARHLETLLADKPREWRPLVYCWRGGQRSGAFTHVLREIGWKAQQLPGGYKAWRTHVMAELEALPLRLAFRVIGGPTGSGKSRLLEALAAQGAQILHLEQLAEHKGSVLGALPTQPQPSQRSFESRLYAALAALDPTRPVFVEAESRRIGTLHLPSTLVTQIRSAPCHILAPSRDARIEFLLRDYDYAVADTAWLKQRLGFLRQVQGQDVLTHWNALIERGELATLVGELLDRHYDPLYRRSQAENYRDSRVATPIPVNDLVPAAIDQLAAEILSRI